MSGSYGSEGRGLLTEDDRKWLRGQHDTGASSRKDRLRKRFVHLMDDLEFLADTDPEDVSGLDDVAELFDHVSKQKSIVPVENAARNLVWLAFLITNREIDYHEIAKSAINHPGGGQVDRSALTDEVLTFYNALSDGIKSGKEHLGDETPNVVVIAANTLLALDPTVERIKDGDDTLTEEWRRINKHVQGAKGRDDNELIDPEDAPEHIRDQILMNIMAEQMQLRNIADKDFVLPPEFLG